MPAPDADEALKSGGARAWWMWIIATTFLLFLFNLQTGYNIINPALAKDLSLTVSQVSMAASVYTVVFAVLQIFSGPILDRFGIRYVIPCAILTVTLGAYLLALAHSYPQLIVAQVVMAIGAIFGFVGAGFAGGEWFGSIKFGYMFGLVQASAAFGSFFGGNLINELLDWYHWRTVINGFGCFGLLLTLVALLFLRDTRDVHRYSLSFRTGIVKELFSVLKIPQIWLSTLMGATLFGGLLSLAVVWASKIIQSYGMEPTEANRASLVIWLGCGIGSGTMDFISKKLRSRKTTLLFNGVGFVIALLLLLYKPGSFYFTSLLTFIIGFTSAAHMLAFTMAAEMVPEALEGTSAAVTNSGLYLISAVMITLPGYLLPHAEKLRPEDFQLAIMPVEIITVISMILCFLFLQDTFKPEKQ
ncbi:MFS transporter [Endozoicomonas sp. SCSIO W0465]|uniref:MFS transporter n=1 Tax=Endozoicomonas sp. SCSIO W0465 TaxID=2918516 RepID=UPI002074FB6A|nr:MFS transporter [Endozoicomonas sp. SCSIO W0465]USE35656.1 MFS transporter [Endozoicomonas sp. SCSIO W0465]